MGLRKTVKKVLALWKNKKPEIQPYRTRYDCDFREGRHIRRTNELLLFKPGLVFTIHEDEIGDSTWVSVWPYKAVCVSDALDTADIEDFDGRDITVIGYQVDS